VSDGGGREGFLYSGGLTLTLSGRIPPVFLALLLLLEMPPVFLRKSVRPGIRAGRKPTLFEGHHHTLIYFFMLHKIACVWLAEMDGSAPPGLSPLCELLRLYGTN
jgi:hypothetical protein